MIPLLKRDLALAVRAGGGFGLGLAFFLIVVTLVPFAVGPQSELLGRIAPGILWLGALLACLLSLDRILALDWEDGSLDLLATAPLPMEGIVSVKALAHWLTTGLPLVIAAPVFGVLLNLAAPGFFWLTLSLLLGTPALSVIGTFGAADIFYAPVVSRFITYGFGVPGFADSYMQAVWTHDWLQQWIAAAEDEQWVIEQYESVPAA